MQKQKGKAHIKRPHARKDSVTLIAKQPDKVTSYTLPVLIILWLITVVLFLFALVERIYIGILVIIFILALLTLGILFERNVF